MRSSFEMISLRDVLKRIYLFDLSIVMLHSIKKGFLRPNKRILGYVVGNG